MASLIIFDLSLCHCVMLTLKSVFVPLVFKYDIVIHYRITLSKLGILGVNDL